MNKCICLLTTLAVVSVFAQNVVYPSVEVRQYSAENGRGIRITALGNLTRLETPMGFEHLGFGRTREGYLIGYSDPQRNVNRLVYHVWDKHSSTLSPGLPDVMPVSFDGPPHNSTFAFGDVVRAKVVVDTRDGVLRLTHNFSWTAGTGTVNIQTIVENRLQLSLNIYGFKRQIYLKTDAGGKWGTSTTAGNWRRFATSITGFGRCDPVGYCPPPPEIISEQLAATHALNLSGSPAGAAVMLKRAGDNSELTSPYPVSNGNRTETRLLGFDAEATLAWLANAPLAGLGKRTFTTVVEEQ